MPRLHYILFSHCRASNAAVVSTGMVTFTDGTGAP